MAIVCFALAASGRAQIGLPRIVVWEQVLPETEAAEIRWPVAVTVRSGDEVAVALAREPRLMVFRKIGVSWQIHRTVGLPAAPNGLAWDGRRYVVSLRGRSELLAFEGADLIEGRIGLPPGVVVGCVAALGAGRLLLFDAAGQRVLEVDDAGELVRDVGVDENLTAIVGTPSNGFYGVVSSRGEVVRYDADGSPVSRWQVPAVGPVPAWPVAVTLDPGGTVAVVDRHGGRILVFDNEGRAVGSGARRGAEPGLLLFPRAMARLPDGRLLIADEGNDRVQIFRRTDLTSQR